MADGTTAVDANLRISDCVYADNKFILARIRSNPDGVNHTYFETYDSQTGGMQKFQEPQEFFGDLANPQVFQPGMAQ